jgi:hypothetical protein
MLKLLLLLLLQYYENIAKTRVVSYSRKTNVLSYEYLLCHAAITRTSSIKDLSVFYDLKLYFHNYVDFILSECIELLGLIRSITFRFSSLECLYVLYFTLVRSKLEYASVVWNSITSTDGNKLSASSGSLRPSVSIVSPIMFLIVIRSPSTFFT